MIFLFCFLNILAMDEDPFEHIRNELGLSGKSNQPSTEHFKEPIGKPKQIRFKQILPKSYYRKDVYIERRKNTLLNRNRTMDPETAHKAATKLYESYIQKKVDKTQEKRKNFKKEKEFMQSFDKDLAKSMRLHPPNTEAYWVEQRVKRLQKQNPKLTDHEAKSHAHKLYSEKNQRDLAVKRARYHRRKANKKDKINKQM